MARSTEDAGLQEELDATNRLLRIGSLFIREGNLESVLGEIVDAAIALSGADFGNIQLLNPETGDLRIVAYRGFPAWWLDYWNTVHKGHGACGTAIAARARVIVEDVERSPIFLGTDALDIQRRAGIRAVQSTPLLSRTGDPIGMMSTHFRAPIQLDSRTLGWIDLVARQAADIVERARVEQALRDGESRFHALADVIADSLYRVSPDWTEMRELTGRGFLASTPAPLTKWIDRYILPEDQPRLREAIAKALETKGVFDLEYRVVRRDGSIGWTWSRVVPIKDARGEIIEWFGAASDVTARKRAELELEEANDRLREIDRRKNAFLAVLSHELRNPLAPIRMNLDLIDRVEPGSQQAEHALAVIRRQSGHLARLVDDLLDVTRITSGKVALQRESLDLIDLLKHTVADHRDAFAEAGLEIDVVAPASGLRIHGDRTRLAQVIGNLLNNAVKFTPRGGHVTASITEDAALGEAVVRVHDTGRGIPPEILPRVFEPFVQADTTLDRSKGGLGLGLAVAKGLVEMHGGCITASSGGAEQGSTFAITLPLDAHPPAPVRPQARTASAVPHKRVLVIEDNVDTADALCSVLQIDGFDTDVAYDGATGLEHAHAFAPDVVVCDIGLPGMDGYQVASALRADPQLSHTGLVALTGYGSACDLDRTKDAGFDEHLAKPVGADDLLNMIAKVTHVAR
jgi:two-component system CheB/CheR fusion protein